MVDVAVPAIAAVNPGAGDTVVGVQGGGVKRLAVGTGSGLAREVDLANATDPAKGAKMVGYSPSVSGGALTVHEYMESLTSGRRAKLVSGVIRNAGEGWQYISDAGHAPLGFSGTPQALDAPEDFKLLVSHPTGAVKVGSLIAAPDETFAGYGFEVGASVGQDESVLRASLPLRFRTYGMSAAADFHPFFGSRVSIAPLGNNTGFRATVPQLQSLAQSPIIANVQFLDSRSTDVRVNAISDTQFDVIAHSDLSGVVTFVSDTTFTVTSDNVLSTLTATWSGGILTVTHDTTGYASLQVMATHMDGGLQPRIASASANSFTVRFYDSAGVQQITPTSAFKFRFVRPHKMPCVMQSTQRCYIDCGRALLYWPDIISASGNIWLLGLMYD